MEKIRLKLKAYDHRVLDRSVASIIEAVKRTGAELIGPIPSPMASLISTEFQAFLRVVKAQLSFSPAKNPAIGIFMYKTSVLVWPPMCALIDATA